jgi:hypothetical protein
MKKCMHSKKDVLAASKVDPSIHSFLIHRQRRIGLQRRFAFNSFVSDTVSLGFILCWFYLFVLVLCESVFVYGFPIYQCKVSLVFSLWLVNDMDWEGGLGKNVFSEMLLPVKR